MKSPVADAVPAARAGTPRWLLGIGGRGLDIEPRAYLGLMIAAFLCYLVVVGLADQIEPRLLWTAIIAGFLISALGGSRVQVGGPTGAFVPILAGIVATFGYGGLALATIMAGVMLDRAIGSSFALTRFGTTSRHSV